MFIHLDSKVQRFGVVAVLDAQQFANSHQTVSKSRAGHELVGVFAQEYGGAPGQEYRCTPAALPPLLLHAVVSGRGSAPPGAAESAGCPVLPVLRSLVLDSAQCGLDIEAHMIEALTATSIACSGRDAAAEATAALIWAAVAVAVQRCTAAQLNQLTLRLAASADSRQAAAASEAAGTSDPWQVD